MAATTVGFCLNLTYNLQDTMNWGLKQLVDVNTGRAQLFSSNHSNNCGAIDGSGLVEKPSFNLLGWLSFCYKLDRVLTLNLLLKVLSRKLELWFVLRSFFLLRLYIISLIPSCLFTQYCCHIKAVSSRFLHNPVQPKKKKKLKRKSYSNTRLKNILVCCHPSEWVYKKYACQKFFWCSFLAKNIFSHKYIILPKVSLESKMNFLFYFCVLL